MGQPNRLGNVKTCSARSSRPGSQNGRPLACAFGPFIDLPSTINHEATGTGGQDKSAGGGVRVLQEAMSTAIDGTVPLPYLDTDTRAREVTERPKVRHWKCRVGVKPHRGFESRPLRLCWFGKQLRDKLSNLPTVNQSMPHSRGTRPREPQPPQNAAVLFLRWPS